MRDGRRDAAAARNPRHCLCQHQADAHVVQTARGPLQPDLGRGAPAHLASCRHSDLAATTRRRKPVPRRRIPGTRGVTLSLDACDAPEAP